MYSTLTYVQEIVRNRVSAVDRLSPKKRLVAVTTVGTTAQREAQAILDSMKTTPTDSVKSATDGEQEGQSITELASLPELAWDVSKPLNQIVHRISGPEKS